MLNVWSDHCRDSISHRITIAAPQPIADFRMSENGCVPLTISFTELTDYGTSWKWDFGDGQNSNERNPIHAYSNPGNYVVVLDIEGPEGKARFSRVWDVTLK